MGTASPVDSCTVGGPAVTVSTAGVTRDAAGVTRGAAGVVETSMRDGVREPVPLVDDGDFAHCGG